jgi:pimeloyl-ACP methyl ester carboxylesterase
MPDVGESMFDWVMKRPALDATPMEMFDDGTSLLTFTEDNIPYDEPTKARLLSVRLRRFSLAGVTTPITGAGWTTVPSTYLVATEDTMIHPDTQREMALRATTVIDLDAEHQLPLSHPDVVAQLLVDLLPN